MKRLLIFLVAISTVIGSKGQTINASANPFLPPTAFIPDSEPHVFEFNGEKKLFIYGSRDERITKFCGYGHDVWSAPVNDLSKWTNHGEVFNVKQVQDIGYGIVDEQHFGAPDCVYNPKTKKYYLYTFLGAVYKMDGKEGPKPEAENYVPGFENFGPKCLVAESKSPAGPFTNPVMCDWPAANSAGAFDPSAIVEAQKDGSIKVYVYWGMKKGDRWAQVDPEDMHTIINPVTGKPDRNTWHKTLNPETITNSSVFEASSIKKIDDDHYVFIYSSDELKSALKYCYASSPEGPWSYGGIIVQNNINYLLGNNHGSIVNVLGKWYIVYHKLTKNSMNRQAMIEAITISIEGDKVNIPQVEMTSEGINVKGLNAYQRYNTNIACYLTNKAFIDGTVREPAGLNPIVGIKGAETTIGFKYFNFGNHAVKVKDNLRLKLNLKVLKELTIKVFIIPFGQKDEVQNRILIGEKQIGSNAISSDFKEIVIPLNKLAKKQTLNKIGGLKGKNAVFISFIGTEDNLGEVVEIEFAKGNNLTPNPLQEIKLERIGKTKLVAVPTRARIGESVKITVDGGLEKSIKVKDKNGKEIAVFENAKAPYALRSFNFFMPNSGVSIQAQ